MNQEDQYVDFKPVIRMQLEGARAQIIHHLSGENVEWEAALDKAIDEAINEFPWKETIKKDATDIIRESIMEYFRQGSGKELITQAVAEAITSAKLNINRDLIIELLEEGIDFRREADW